MKFPMVLLVKVNSPLLELIYRDIEALSHHLVLVTGMNILAQKEQDKRIEGHRPLDLESDQRNSKFNIWNQNLDQLHSCYRHKAPQHN